MGGREERMTASCERGEGGGLGERGGGARGGMGGVERRRRRERVERRSLGMGRDRERSELRKMES